MRATLEAKRETMSTLTLRTRLAQTVACASLLAVHSVAEAAWPDDISLSSMPTYEGSRVLSTSTLSEAYTTLVRELGASIEVVPSAPRVRSVQAQKSL